MKNKSLTLSPFIQFENSDSIYNTLIYDVTDFNSNANDIALR